MKIGEKIFGFTLKSQRKVKELSASFNIFEHEKSGARLCFIEREDSNLSFAIGFKTPPSDSTGVFHIIEHSVLCGSKKFPVKEPFVELLKGSLNTFLNAMTYEDRTVYPVASRCEKDFYNLVDVYLDAVFHPLMLEDENIFMQEGHHLEYDEKTDTLHHSGVVFNEMQGVYSSPDELSDEIMSKLLFGGTLYGYDSGGAPDVIPELTYEDFCAAHKKYYRPENAYIVLDGSINIEKTFSLIDSYLSEYEKEDFALETVYPEPRICPAETVYYESGKEDDGKAKLLFSSVVAKIYEKEKKLAVSVLIDALAGSNEAPLKKKLLETGFCEDVSVYANKNCTNTVTLELHGISESDIPELSEAVKRAISEIIESGINSEHILATINRLKFRLREKDYGSLPRGIAFALSVMDVWLYGVDPEDGVTYEDTIASLTEKAKTNYYNDLLLNMTFNSPHRATLIMVARDEKSEISRRIEEGLAALRSKMTDEDIAAVKEADRRLKERQQSPDAPEAIAAVPKLSVEDISDNTAKNSLDVFNIKGAEILRHKSQISGILYTELYFCAENLTDEELTVLSILSVLLTNLDTENHTAAEIKEKIKGSLGSFSPNALAYTDLKVPGRAIPLFTLSASALTESKDALLSLIREVLLFTKFDNTDKIKKILTQLRSSTEDTVFSSGDGISIERLEGSLSDAGRKNEEIFGIPAYRRIKHYEKNFEKEGERLISMLRSLSAKLFVKSGLTISLAGDSPDGFAEEIVSLFPDGEPYIKESPNAKKAARKEAVILPIRVSHAAMGFKADWAAEMLGVLRVVRSILSYEYLWNQVRVVGGAYGTGFVARRHGTVMLYSYRDPSPAKTLEVFKKSSDFLMKFAKSNTDLTKYIIGAYGDVDTLQTPRIAAKQASADYITGWTPEDEKKLRHDIINTKAEDLVKAAAKLSELADASYTVVCGKDMKSTLGDIDFITP